MLKHEEDARKVFENARNFKPVYRLGRIVGWTFFVPRAEGENGSGRYSWVNLNGNVPSDTYDMEHLAGAFLRSYRKVKAKEKRA